MKNQYAQLSSPLADLLKLFKAAKQQGVVIGGVASSLLGKPRFTADIDMLSLMPLQQVAEFVNIAKNHHIVPRVNAAVAFARHNRVLLMKHLPSGIFIDISLGNLIFEEELFQRAIKLRLGKLNIPLPSVEDLIIMKICANREKDIEDVRGLVEKNSRLDKKRILFWVKEYGELLANSNMIDTCKKLLKRH